MTENNTIKLLDHGFVKLLNIAGPIRRTFSNPKNFTSLNDIEEYQTYDLKSSDFKEFDADDIDPAISARISFNNFEEDRSKEQDLKLVEYLLKNKHWSPFEMVEIWLEMKLPIFLARQFIRHKSAHVNEVSARYSVLPKEWYIPEVVGGKPTNGIKQGQEDNLNPVTQNWFKTSLNTSCLADYSNYLVAIDRGIAPEHARLFLHVNHYTHWIWHQNLRDILHFLTLRLDSHAQVEARCYAQAIYDLLNQHLPETMKLFDKYLKL